MAEESLGSAVLEITVNATPALGQLQKFQQDASNLLANIQVGIDAKQSLDRFQQDVAAAGAKAGKAASGAIKAAVSKLSFKDLQEALSFGGALDGTVKDLRDYKRALEDLRETTKTTSPDFQQLNDLIYQLGNQIKNETRSTTELVRALQQLRDASANQKLKEAVAQHKEAEKAARAQAKANRELADSFLSVAKRSGSFALKAPGAIAKGVGGAINLGKGAINAGRAGYDIGAELGIFEAPKDGPLKQSITAIIDRFRFLGEQATTTRGQILRLIEGVGAAEAFNQISQNTDLLRTSLDGVSVASKVAEGTLSGLAKAGQFFANITPDNAFFSPLKQLLQDAANLEKLGAGVAGGSDFFAQFGVEAGKAALDQIDNLTSLIAALPPELAAVAGGVVGMYAAFEGDSALKQLQEIANRLKLVGTEALNVDKALSEAISGQAKADFDALPKQLPAFRERGLQRLDVDNNGLKAARDYTQGLVDASKRANFELKAARDLAEQFPDFPYPKVDIFEAVNASLKATLSSLTEIVAEEQLQNKLAQDARQLQLAEIRGAGQLADAERKRTAELKKQDEERRMAGLEELISVTPKSRLAQRGEALPSRPTRTLGQRASDATGSALIGGAFPLLFGQGVGASVGGGLGGALGGLKGGQFGFGLSLVGTIIGSQVDEAVRKLGVLGGALKDPIGRFGELAEAGLFSSGAVQKNIEALIASGREAEAAAEIQLDLARTYGNQDELIRLNTAFDDLKSSFSTLGVVMGNFIAGPLADFLDKLARSGTLFAQQATFDGRLSDLGVGDGERKQIITQAREEAKAIGDLSQLYAIAGRIVDETYGKTEDVIEAENRLAKAKERQIELDDISGKLIEAQVDGRKREAAALQLRETTLKRQAALEAAPVEQRDAINRKFNPEIRKLELEQRQLSRETFAQRFSDANKLASIEEAIAIQRRRSELTSTGTGALETIRAFRDARRAEVEAQAQLRVSPFDENLRSAAIEASRTVELSAAKAKNDLIDAFKAAKESVRSISRSLEDSKLQLGELQNTRGAGLNQFLPRQFVQQRQEQLNADLRPLAESIARRLGVQFSVSGTLEQRNAQLIDLIRSDRAETRLREDIFDTRQDLDRATNDLAEVNRSLVQINGDLASATTTLANKDWNVYVNVPGGSYSTDSRLQGVYN